MLQVKGEEEEGCMVGKREAVVVVSEYLLDKERMGEKGTLPGKKSERRVGMT